jgi:hypothetical protein
VRLGYAIEQIGAKRVVVDTIEALFSNLSNETILGAELSRLFGWLKERGLTTMASAAKLIDHAPHFTEGRLFVAIHNETLERWSIIPSPDRRQLRNPRARSQAST